MSTGPPLFSTGRDLRAVPGEGPQPVGFLQGTLQAGCTGQMCTEGHGGASRDTPHRCTQAPEGREDALLGSCFPRTLDRGAPAMGPKQGAAAVRS